MTFQHHPSTYSGNNLKLSCSSDRSAVRILEDLGPRDERRIATPNHLCCLYVFCVHILVVIFKFYLHCMMLLCCPRGEIKMYEYIYFGRLLLPA